MESAENKTMGVKLAGASILCGIAGDVILGSESWGVSLPAFAAFVIALVLLLGWTGKRPLSRTSAVMLGSAFAFSLCFLWRDAPGLKLVDGLAVFALVGLAGLDATGKKLSTARIGVFAFEALGVWAVFVGEFFRLIFRDVKWAEMLKEKGVAGTSAVGRGLLMAFPLVLVFGGLLISADAAFQGFFERLASFDSETVWTHIGVFSACALLTGGFLRHFFLAKEAPKTDGATLPPVSALALKEPFRLGATEIAIVLGALDILFALFVLVESPYLFGGLNHVLATEHLSIAEYARRGFFELVGVIALAIPVLLGSQALVDRRSPTAQPVWRAAALIMIVLLFAVMQSAVQRMRLYVDFYSLSELRIYVLASLGWMGLTLLWLLTTTVRGWSARFGSGAFAALLATILSLNIANPDALIVRFNVAEVSPGKPIDGEYLRGLSDDATPFLAANLSRLDAGTRKKLVADWAARDRWERGRWRSWNLSRGSAEEVLRSIPTATAAAVDAAGER